MIPGRTILMYFFVVTLSIPVPSSSAWSFENRGDNNIRQQCLNVLYNALASEDYRIKAHAAEALIYNVYTDSVQAYFTRPGIPPQSHIIPVSMIMAGLHKKYPVQYQKYIQQIFEAFLHAHTKKQKIYALQSLAQLGYHDPQPEIIQLAAHGDDTLKVFSRWVLANSGDAKDENRLGELLDLQHPGMCTLTAYALGFMKHIHSSTFERLKRCESRLPKDVPGRVYITSALFIHSSPPGKKLREELLYYSQGNALERKAAANALAARGTARDDSILVRLLGDPDADVQISAANALLRIERRMHRGLQWPDWTVIVIYVLLMLSIGFYYSKRQKTSEEYLVGGRQINSFVSGISLFASFFSTISFLAIAGEVIKHGPLVIMVMIVSFPVIYGISAYFFIPFFMKLPITSAYQILEKPLGRGVRMTGSLIFLLTRFVWMALLIYLTSKALVIMFGWDSSFILYLSLFTGLITVIYSTMGGLKAVVTTDVIQFFILMAGALITIVLVTINVGGISGWVPTQWAPNWDQLVVFSWSPYIRLTIVFAFLHTLAWWVSTAGSDQMAIQRFIATRDVKAARRTFLTTQIGEKVLFFILMCVGFSLLAFYRAHPNFIPDGKDLITDADFLFPHFIANFLPVGLGGIVIAALFSAAMSSISSGLNSTAAIITTDIIPWVTKTTRSTDNLKLAKWCSLSVGLLVLIVSTLMQYVPGNINEVTAKTNGIFISPLFNLFFMALFVRFATPFGAIMGSVYGLAAGALIAFWDLLTGQPGITFLWIGPVSLLVSIGMSLALSLIPVKGKSWQIKLVWTIIFIFPLIVLFVLIVK